MASAINVTLPATSSSLVSAGVRSNFVTTSNEITALQNRTDSLQSSITLVQNQVTPLQAGVTALQTKTNVSGDGGLAANGALTVTALQGRAVAATAPTANQVLAWSGSQWVPMTVTAGGGGSGTVNAGSAGQIAVYPSTGTTLSGVNLSGDGILAANGTLTVAGLRGRALATAAPANGQVLAWVQASNAWTPTTPAAGVGGVVTGITPPATPVDGQLWWDAQGGALYIYYNDGTSRQWVIASPPGIGGGGGTAGDAWLPLTGGNLTGPLGVNTAGGNVPAATVGNVLQLASSSNTNLTIDAAGSTQVPRVVMRRAGGTLDNLAAAPNSAQIGVVEFLGWTGNAVPGFVGANIQCVTTAAWNAGSAPMRMNFMTTQAGSVSPALAMYIGSSGGFVVGGTTPGGDRGAGTINAQAVFCVADLNVGGAIYIAGQQVSLGANDSGGPGYRALRVPN